MGQVIYHLKPYPGRAIMPLTDFFKNENRHGEDYYLLPKAIYVASRLEACSGEHKDGLGGWKWKIEYTQIISPRHLHDVLPFYYLGLLTAQAPQKQSAQIQIY